MGCVHRCSDGPIGICRNIQAIVACLFLFIGIVCQFYAGSNINDIPLGTLCETYSGSSELMDQEEFDALFDWVQDASCRFNRTSCCMAERNTACIDYDLGASYFLVPTLGGWGGGQAGRLDLIRYAGPFFWCKYTPQLTAMENATCFAKMFTNFGVDPQPCKVHPDQQAAPGGNANWYIAASKVQSSIRHVSCNHKLRVYTNFLRALYGPQWSDQEVHDAGAEFYSSCLVDKGSGGYILIIGPVMALLGGVVATLTMLDTFNKAPWPAIGTNLLLVGAILLLVGFWSISLSTTTETFSAYTFCGDNGAPLVTGGRWFDGTPCIDRDSRGGAAWNPFVMKLLGFDSTYIAGGVFCVMATTMFLGLVSGFTEKMMGKRFAKYLIDTRDFFQGPNLPFPSRTGQQ